MPRAFDIIGKIAILKLPPELKRKEKIIAAELLKLKQVSTVVDKVGKIKGKLRKAQYKVLAGQKTFETVHKENNCFIKLDISKVYFSPRLAADRLEIAKQVKAREKVLVMFAGAAPYALAIAKNSRAKEIWAIEISKAAVKYALENLKLNKVKNVQVIQGNVQKVASQLKGQGLKFDRIVMPRPQLKETFLKEAFILAARRCTVHFHDFVAEEDFKTAEEKIKSEAAKFQKKIKILRWKKIGEIAPYKYRIRVDFRIL